ncbi:MAG: cytochrome c [Verrucomicrobia bacterium]|nr:MAG: cytochrome c [Verrucomicrobiota bacterium]
MKRCSIRATKWRISEALVVALVIVLGAVTAVLAKDDGAAPAKKAPTGAQLYAMNCGRCHMERYAKERTDAQWQTIITHMRVHANLPGADARKIIEYLQASN